MLCVLLDLGDLNRSDRVVRILGPRYASGIRRAARQRVQDTIGPDIPVHHAGSDCLAFTVRDTGDGSWQPLVERVLDTLREPLCHAGLPGAFAPYAGAVRFDPAGADARSVLRQAALAAQEARDADTPWRLHDGTGDGPYERLRGILADLAPALASADQLSLVYQPRIHLASGACVSVEALLRWDHPVLGSIPPGEFVPLAEQTGMVRHVTGWVLDRALRDLAQWTRDGFGHGVSINVSANNLAEEGFAARLRDALAIHAVSADRVELELTEGALLGDKPRVRATLAEVAALGVGISIDDFGTGYSNLFYLRDVPAGTIKIDQCFVRWIASNDRDPVIVRSMVHLAHALGYRVVAEGIEDAGALAMLAGWGCDEGQGYHISRPVPLDELRAWLAGRPDAARTGQAQHA